jgi:hypothetical protein
MHLDSIQELVDADFLVSLCHAARMRTVGKSWDSIRAEMLAVRRSKRTYRQWFMASHRFSIVLQQRNRLVLWVALCSRMRVVLTDCV